MPVIRDGNNRVEVFDRTPREQAVYPPGPIERRRVSAQRMADFAVERAHAAPTRRTTSADLNASRRRGSAASAQFVRRSPAPEDPPMTLHHDAGRSSEPRQPRHRGPGGQQAGQKAVDRDVRAQSALEALERHGGDREAAAAELGMRLNAFAMVIKHARLRAIDDTPRRLELLLANPDTASVLDPVPTSALEPLEPVWSQPIVAIDGEDRCGFGSWLGTTHLLVCDRGQGHHHEHRGRLFRVGFTGSCEPIGHAAVPA